MNIEEIKHIISSGEGYNAEFKVRVPQKVKELTQEICAFANAAGGTLLIGVDDDNAIQGVEIDNSKRSAIQNSIREISPKISCQLEIVIIEGKKVGLLEVTSGPNKPYVLSGAIYVRIGSNTQKLTTAEEMRDFFQQANRIYFDEVSCHDFIPEQDIDADFLTVFKNQSGLSSSVPDEQIFQNLKLYTSEGPFKNGAVLFFGFNTTKYFEKATIRCVAYDGNNKRFIADDKTMNGPLFLQYKETLSWLRGKLNIRYDIEGAGSGPRIEIWEIPETVLKEALINALSHRDYYDKGGRINVELFHNRIEISNPGGLVSAIPDSEFGNRSYSRNPLIFGLFERMKMVEQIGSGITRMKDLMSEANLPLPEFHYHGMFTVIFQRPVDFEKWVNQWDRQLSENRITILKSINQNPNVTKRELKDIVGIGSTAIDNNIEFLRKNGFLSRVGSDKGGKWVIQYKTS